MSMTLAEIWPGPLWEPIVIERLGKAQRFEQRARLVIGTGIGQAAALSPSHSRRHLPTANSQQPTPRQTDQTLVVFRLRIRTFHTAYHTSRAINSRPPRSQSPTPASPSTHTDRPTCPPASSKWADQAALASLSSSSFFWVCLIACLTRLESVC